MDEAVRTQRRHHSLILVIDDVEINRRVLTRSLNAYGYHNILTANDGEQALKVTHECKPDLIILDLMMPVMDGFAYCKEIRQDKRYDNVPILVQTALDEIDKKLMAFKLGANDYICKPIDPGELSARTEVHLNQKILLEDLRAYHKKMTEEIDSARQMQDRLMPNPHQVQICERVYDMKIAHHFETSSALGGDCWGMRPLSDKHLAVYMFDFSGRGVTSAMNVFRMHTIMQEFLPSGSDPGQFLSRLNRHLYALLHREELATMFYGVIDTEANCLLYASAAAPPALLFPRSGETMMLGGRGFPLGVIPEAEFETRNAPFGPDDLLVFFSDCILGARNERGEFLDIPELISLIETQRKTKPENEAKCAVDTLVAKLRAHDSAPVFDDNTINAYWRCPAPGPRVEEPR